MKKYTVINIGDAKTVEEAMMKRNLIAIATFDKLVDAVKVKNAVELVSASTFEPTELVPEFISKYRIITIKEVK